MPKLTVKELMELRNEQLDHKDWLLDQIQSHLDSGVSAMNPTVQSLTAMLEKCNERINKYHAMMDDLGKTGRPSLGVTKKVSITLPEEVWKFLDDVVETSESNRSAVLRDILLNAYEADIDWFQQVFGKNEEVVSNQECAGCINPVGKLIAHPTSPDGNKAEYFCERCTSLIEGKIVDINHHKLEKKK